MSVLDNLTYLKHYNIYVNFFFFDKTKLFKLYFYN